jgi:hypothetical protein
VSFLPPLSCCPKLFRPSCRSDASWPEKSALELVCLSGCCSAPPRRRRRLCADHRVEPYACRCRCRRSARAPRLTFMSLSPSSVPPCLCRRSGQTTGLHTRARTRREAEGFAFGSPYLAEPKFLPCLAVVRSPGRDVVVCLVHSPSPSLPPRSSRWLAHTHTLGGKASPLGALSHTRAPHGTLMRRCEHVGNLNATPPLWCFTVV